LKVPVNETKHNPVDGRTAKPACTDVFGKLKNCYARFRVPAEKRKHHEDGNARRERGTDVSEKAGHGR
jgi:hypothetical protein